MNSSDTHDHMDEKELAKSIRKYVCQTNELLFQVYNLKMLEQTLNKCSNLEKSALEALPAIILEKIFKECSHKALFDLTNACPQFLNEILNPIYWRFIKIDFSELFFNHIDILTIVMYLNQNLRRLSFKGSKWLNIECLSLYFNYTPNLTHLELGSVRDFSFDFIKTITNKLKNLVFINLEWNSKVINDECLMWLLDLKNLHSIDLSQCFQLSDSAILEFVRSVKKLVYFNIDGIVYIKDEYVS